MIQTVIDELVVCLERGEGIAVLTAPAGMGKTLLCEKVRQEVAGEFVTILLRHADFRAPVDLLRTFLIELGQKGAPSDSEQELRLQLIGALTELRRQSKFLVVICDEAHQLTEEVLEELRRLVDHADHGVPWSRLLLAGQLDLEEKLAGPQLSALNQRLRSHASLSPLTMQESIDYLDYRLTWAGGRIEEIFHPDALTAIVDAADGNPRCLNQLCDHVLLLAYVAEQQPAIPELVQEALADLQHLPLTWNLRGQRLSSVPDFDAAPPTSRRQSSGSSVEFGDHLATWESTPRFSEPSSPFEGSDTEVWEFGSESANSSVETPSGEVREEAVIDRYAAIDAGWPVENLPREEASPMSFESESPKKIEGVIPVSEINSSVEARLHADVLELMTTAEEALNSRSWEAVETPTPLVAAERPFRNLFTRLRRKKKGLE